MSNTNTGGPAFPSPTDGMLDNEGMTLRDYFAAKAMQGFIAAGRFQGHASCAADSYAMADSMLKAREA